VTTAAELYRYRATVQSWIDGDTARVDVDLGCHVHWHGSLRVAGMNAPEVRGPSRQAGLLAAAEVERLCPAGSTVYLDSLAFEHTSEEDDFGRMLAEVTLADGRDLAELMIAGGYAVKDPA
jgi:micrococcal nuclease